MTNKEKGLELYSAGMPLKDIEGLLGVSRQTIYVWAKSEGLEGRRGTKELICPNCINLFTVKRKSTRIYCSWRCYNELQLSNKTSQYHKGNWRKKTTIRTFQRIARATIEAAGYAFQKGQVVHHINGDVTNNSLHNLFIFWDSGAHLKYHHEVRNANLRPPKHAIEGLHAIKLF